MDETLTQDRSGQHETIGEQSRALKAAWPGVIGAESTAVFLAEQAELRAAGVPDDAVRIGAALPDADLQGAGGEPVRLADALGGAPAVLVFYRGAWCPFCNLAVHTYAADLLPALAARDVRLLAIGPQAPDRAAAMGEAHDVGFPMLADPGNGLASRLGITMRPGAAGLDRLRLLGFDVAAHNVDGRAEVPYPTVLVVDAERVVRFVDVRTDYSSRTEVADVLVAVDALLLTS